MPFPAFFLLAAALGTREHIRSRRTKGRILDAEADRQDAINSIDLGIDSMGISNSFDARQLDAMQRQFQTAQGMLKSLDPKLQGIGANMLQDLDSAVRGNIQQNETEARADVVRLQDQEIAAAGLGKADNEKRFERELTMNRLLNDELKSFVLAQVNYKKTINLLDQNDQLASLAGLTAFVQSIDNSVVREGELIKYKGANGLITELVNLVNKSEGRDFDEKTKVSLRNAAAALVNAEKTRAVTVTNSYQDRAVSFGLDPKRVLSGVDENLFTPIGITQTTQQALQEQADQAELQFNAEELAPTDESLGSQIVTPLVRGTQRILSDVRRNLTGVKLLRGPNGELVEQAADGKLTTVGRDTIFETEDGRTMRLVDRGDGRFEWIEIEASSEGFVEQLFSPEASQQRREQFPNIKTDQGQ